jgi:hypothetical protein
VCQRFVKKSILPSKKKILSLASTAASFLDLLGLKNGCFGFNNLFPISRGALAIFNWIDFFSLPVLANFRARLKNTRANAICVAGITGGSDF